MNKIVFRMYLKSGNESQYRKRHDEIWPELVDLLRAHGIHNYTIFLDPNGVDLFAMLMADARYDPAALATHPVMKQWWDHMADIMLVNDDNSPIVITMDPVFHLD